ncbi:MAG TPA: IS1595 family transposase, partial [Hanamia sp.]|nr:IS1595 family transposase [Hanamia sp.]
MDKKFRFVGVNSIKFNRHFKDDASCYEYLASIKWTDETFECK